MKTFLWLKLWILFTHASFSSFALSFTHSKHQINIYCVVELIFYVILIFKIIMCQINESVWVPLTGGVSKEN